MPPCVNGSPSVRLAQVEDDLKDESSGLAMQLTGKLMEVNQEDLSLQVNYSDRLVLFLREVRQLSALGFKIPEELKWNADVALKFYRHGVVLKQVTLPSPLYSPPPASPPTTSPTIAWRAGLACEASAMALASRFTALGPPPTPLVPWDFCLHPFLGPCGTVGVLTRHPAHRSPISTTPLRSKSSARRSRCSSTMPCSSRSSPPTPPPKQRAVLVARPSHGPTQTSSSRTSSICTRRPSG